MIYALFFCKIVMLRYSDVSETENLQQVQIPRYLHGLLSQVIADNIFQLAATVSSYK